MEKFINDDIVFGFAIGALISGVGAFLFCAGLFEERTKRIKAETRAETLEQIRDARHIALPFKTLEELEAFLETEAARLFPPEKTK